jgi:hypothetical protein
LRAVQVNSGTGVDQGSRTKKQSKLGVAEGAVKGKGQGIMFRRR